MTVPPLISICIPAYKQVEFLKRLLESISIQTFRDFEVVVTDDSNDDTVYELIKNYKHNFPITYTKNTVALGSPENWNASIKLAKGEWIKMMHDDDWFVNELSLAKFAEAAKISLGTSFIFSGYTEINVRTNSRKNFIISNFYLKLLEKSPLNLFKQNFIGHPSTTLVKNNPYCLYDKNLKWVVDFEFYIRYINKYKSFVAIKDTLITIGISEYQITKAAFRNPEVEIPENLYLLHKFGEKILKNIFVYDYYWRLIRNLSLRSLADIEKYTSDIKVPTTLKNMLYSQASYPQIILKKGLMSKALMFMSYWKNYRDL